MQEWDEREAGDGTWTIITVFTLQPAQRHPVPMCASMSPPASPAHAEPGSLGDAPPGPRQRPGSNSKD